MIYSATVKYLVNQIVLEKLSYLGVITAKPELKDQVDCYITDKGFTINKTL